MRNRWNQDMAPLRLNMYLLSVLLCLIVIGQVEPKACAYDHFTIESGSGNLTCLKCPLCEPGLGLSPPCGRKLSNHHLEIKCEKCILGETYSAHKDISSCKPCGSCADHQTIVKNCTLDSDSQCKDTCSKGFYFEDLTGDCQPCSWCCSDGSNKVRSGCKDMPLYKQCDVNTAKNCKPKCQNGQYVVPGSKVSMYYWRLRRKTITSHQSLALLLACEEESSDNRFEDPTVSGLQETLCFEKSGVNLQFSDPESFVNDGQGIRSKICWDKALTVSLPSHEIQLSPVVQFYPHGSKLSKPVHATIPHSALMDSSHRWSIGLKSFTLKSGPKIGWKEEIVDKIHDNEVSFYMDCLLSYVVVGTPVYKSSKGTKKRFQCAVFGDKEGKVGQDYTVYLYLIDDCEASLEKLMQDERSKSMTLLGSPQSIYVEAVFETDVKIAIKQLCGGWKIAPTNPQVITHKSIKESYRTFPCAEILFQHDDARNRDFRCNIELTADDTTIQIYAVTSIKEDPFLRYMESHTGQQHKMVTGRGKCDPTISNSEKSLLHLCELPEDVMHTVIEKLNQSLQHSSNWQQLAERLDITKEHVERFPGRNPGDQLLQYLQTKRPHTTVREFAQVLQDTGHSDAVESLRSFASITSWNMPLFKVWSEDKLNKKLVVAENLAELVSKGIKAILFIFVYFMIAWRDRMLHAASDLAD
ncbi:netrin receptor UNC5B-a-like isoform X3 [Acropora palmata]|uniref:netrin receptor UNC5B-a-like isoform X3 n=1 Tax=Acropora palmata TaxID=6131 RepID=UPI003DA1AAC0